MKPRAQFHPAHPIANDPSMTIPSLDGIRAISILLVLVGHAGYGKLVPGGFGVTIFFFLSGYLITSLMLAEHASSGRINILHFCARRFFRLMPPLFITLTLAYLLTIAGILPGQATLQGYLAQLLYVANYYAIFVSDAVPNGTGILWSLAVEEHYYILYPFVMAFLLARTEPRTIVVILALVCAAVLGWRCVLVLGVGAEASRTYYATDTRIDSIIYGCIFAIAMTHFPKLSALANVSHIRLLGLLAGGALLLFTLLYRNDAFRETARYSLQGIALMPIFHYAITAEKSPLFRLLNSRVMVKVGIYSYSIYLVHYVIINLLETHVEVARMRPVLLSAALLASVAYAMLIDRYVDPYFRRLRKRMHAAPA